jgi:hypothetical protein
MRAGLRQEVDARGRNRRNGLYGLGQEVRLELRVRGLRVSIAASDPTLLDEFPVWRIPEAAHANQGRPGLRYCLDSRPSSAGTIYSVYCDSRRIGRAGSRSEALNRLLSHLQVRAAEAAPGEVFVHAGVVAWMGRAIVLPGRSFCGKTSLVLELVRRGATYYSDEYAVFDSSGMVHPYPRPLHVRSQCDSEAQVLRAEELGLALGSEPLSVALVLFSKFVPGSAWHARRLTPGGTMLGFLANTVCARKRPQESIESLRAVALGAHAYRVRRGEAGCAAQEVLNLLPSFNNEKGSRNET